MFENLDILDNILHFVNSKINISLLRLTCKNLHINSQKYFLKFIPLYTLVNIVWPAPKWETYDKFPKYFIKNTEKFVDYNPHELKKILDTKKLNISNINENTDLEEFSIIKWVLDKWYSNLNLMAFPLSDKIYPKTENIRRKISKLYLYSKDNLQNNIGYEYMISNKIYNFTVIFELYV